MHKILIIGAAGFIGTHVFNYFNSKGFEVYGCDIESSTNIKNSKFYYINPKNPDYKKVIYITNPKLIINASGSGSVEYSIQNTIIDFELNVLNTIRILDAIKNYTKNCKFINLSSAAVYGNSDKLPIKENYKISPRSPYGFHKYLSELICKEYFNMYEIQTCNLRIFSAYGPGLKKQIFWDLYQKYKVTNNNTISLFGSGEELRDFIYIDDLVNAMYLIYNNSPFEGESINVANAARVKLKSVVEIYINYLDPSVKIVFNDKTKDGDPTNLLANIDILKSYNYVPQYSIEEGLIKYIQWLGEND